MCNLGEGWQQKKVEVKKNSRASIGKFYFQKKKKSLIEKLHWEKKIVLATEISLSTNIFLIHLSIKY